MVPSALQINSYIQLPYPHYLTHKNKMTSTNSSNRPNFLKEVHFNGTNYVTFKNCVLIACRYLDGTIEKPTPAPETIKKKLTEWFSKDPFIEEWEERDTWASELIIYNTKNPIDLGIKMDRTAAEAWIILTKKYGIFFKIATMNAEEHL